MKFYKMNGAGNSFAIFDARELGGPLVLSPERVRAIADKRTGAGCDQVLALEVPQAPGSDVFMRIWNADGSHAGACGNGTRCVAWLVMEETGKSVVYVDTQGGILTARRTGELQVAVDMGKPKLEWEQIPLSEPMNTKRMDLAVGPADNPLVQLPGAVNMGNPHAVFVVDDVDAIDIEKLGPMLEYHPLFPQQANIGFAQKIARDKIRLRVWERGAGLTKACGSGACAALVAAARRRYTAREADVILDGGTLHIHWREEDDHVIMTGPVELEGSGDVPI